MKDTLVSAKTSKLAKIKGFNWVVNHIYHLPSESPVLVSNPVGNEHLDYFEALAPSQSLLQKWLREKKIFVEAVPIRWDLWYFVISEERPDKPIYITCMAKEDYKTYEEALEDGLFSALEIVK